MSLKTSFSDLTEGHTRVIYNTNIEWGNSLVTLQELRKYFRKSRSKFSHLFRYTSKGILLIDSIPIRRYNLCTMYTVKEASKSLALDPSQVRRLLRSDEIKGKKLARDWVVLELN